MRGDTRRRNLFNVTFRYIGRGNVIKERKGKTRDKMAIDPSMERIS